MQELLESLKKLCRDLFGVDIEPELTRPEPQFGDYSTNVAMHLAGKLNKNPREIAEEIKKNFSHDSISSVEIAGPGFINIYLSDQTILDSLNQKPLKAYKGQSIVVEYSDPNPFKVLHVGHFYTSVIGDVIANLLEAQGANVHRVNFGGDVGLHVAKTMWAIIKELGGENPAGLRKAIFNPDDIEWRAGWLSKHYIQGTNAYESNAQTKVAIEDLNKRIYQILETEDKTSDLAQIYWTCRAWSYDYFKYFYKTISIKPFDKYYPESETVKPGLALVRQNMGKVFRESNGAVVFEGEVHNLHTRVFINSQGLPTYETKDLGLMVLKSRDYHFDKSIIITGNEQYEYMQVVLKAIEQIKPGLASKTKHLTHGMVKLPGSEKMSSRKGNIVEALDIIISTANAARTAHSVKDDSKLKEITFGAVKYAFLKNRIGADIIFNSAESVSLEGNSGPYLQYAHARARSILRKSSVKPAQQLSDLEPMERILARKISEYPEVIEKSTRELMPHYICTYIYELAQTFNGFYEKCRVVGDPREAVRLKLVTSYAETLKNGLELLNIVAPEQL